MKLPSRVDRLQLNGRSFFVKRDDLVDPLLAGNKFRKLQTLIDTPADRYTQIISWGGSQSNAMLAIAALAAQKSWQFHYTTRQLPERLRSQPTGNLKAALDLGMRLKEVAHSQYPSTIADLGSRQETGSLVLPQGGADPVARDGIRLLAAEIRDWQRAEGIEKLNVVTPSGTGTTAGFLADALTGCEVITTAVIGDTHYLKQQIGMLGLNPPNLVVLEPVSPVRFARPHPDLLGVYQQLCSAGIEFDLIYAPPMWNALLHNLDRIEGEILYLHSGGVSGNATMLDRYRHAGWL